MRHKTIKLSVFAVCCGVLMIAMACPCLGAQAKELTIVKNGKAQSHIFIDPTANKVEKFAASELQRYIEKISGAKLKIYDQSSESAAGVPIRLHVRELSAMRYDGYTVEVTEKNIILTGTNSRGVLFAVYDILESLGCLWVYQGADEEVIPSKKTLSLQLGRKLEQPVIEHRCLTPYGTYAGSVELTRDVIDWMAKNRYNLVLMSIDRPSDSGESEAHGQHWEPIADELLPEVKKRGMLLSMSEHSMPYYFPRSLFKEHPEWFSLLDGKRHPGQMCYSNKEAVEYYAKAQATFAAKHPEIDMLGTWPLDGGGYCECEGCKDLETVFKAVVKVAEEVEKVQPGMIVEHLAYKPQTFKVPETVEIPTNVSVLVCNRTDQLARDWVEAMQGKGGAYYFEYRLADHYNWVANVWLQPQYALEITKICSDIGYRSIASLYLPVQVWWRASLNYYFMGKAMWDIEMDVQEELDKYCRAYYADQADKVRQVFDILLEKIQNRVLEGTHFFPDGRKNKLPVARWV